MTSHSLTILASMVALLGLVSCTVFLLLRRSGRVATPLPLAQLAEVSPLGLAPVLPFEKSPKLVAGVTRNVARVSALTHREAENLLDWLEQHGYNGRQILSDADELFTVEFQLDEGHVMPTPPHAGRTGLTSHSSAG